MQYIWDKFKAIFTVDNFTSEICWGIALFLGLLPLRKGWNFLRSPNIQISPDANNPSAVIFKNWTYIDDKGTHNEVLRLKITNVPRILSIIKSREKWLKWVQIRPAMKCYFIIHFLDESGRKLFKEPMLARISTRYSIENSKYSLPIAIRVEDIYPNHELLIDVVIRLEGGLDCYGLWHYHGYSCSKSVTDPNSLVNQNESYWRKHDETWKLGKGIFKVLVDAHSESNILKREYFTLINLPTEFGIKKSAKFHFPD